MKLCLGAACRRRRRARTALARRWGLIVAALILGSASLVAAWGLAGPAQAVGAASSPELDAAASAPAAETLLPQFQDIGILGGLDHPTVVRFAPDGRVFVAQKNGEILVYDSMTSPTPKLFADLRTE